MNNWNPRHVHFIKILAQDVVRSMAGEKLSSSTIETMADKVFFEVSRYCASNDLSPVPSVTIKGYYTDKRIDVEIFEEQIL